jgi:hypothetical protein
VLNRASETSSYPGRNGALSSRLSGCDDLAGMKYDLELFLLGGAFELWEGNSFLATLDGRHAAVEVAYGKLILSGWGEGWSRSWRVLSCELAAARIRLSCTKQMGLVQCVLDLRRGKDELEFRGPRPFPARLAALIESSLPGLSVKRAREARDDRRHFSGSYVRLMVQERGAGQGSIVAGIGVSPERVQTVVDGALAAGLIWADALRKMGHRVSRLMVLAPAGRATTIANRLTMLNPGQEILLYEFDEEEQLLRPVSAFDQGDLADNFKKASTSVKWPEDEAAGPELEQLVGSVVAMAPDFIETRLKDGGISIAIRGLEFARASTRDKRLYFGLGGQRHRLGKTNRADLQQMIRRIIDERGPYSDDRNSDIYRAQSERWLESIIRNQAALIDVNIDSRYVYSQVPAYRGEERTFIDLLACTRGGRLVVMELKTAEDSDFPFQGLDYWLRVNWHGQRGDFKRRGYFSGIELSDEPPVLYLVAPLFRFHWATTLIARTFSTDVPIYRIGINEDWRAKIRVLMRERLNETNPNETTAAVMSGSQGSAAR